MSQLGLTDLGEPGGEREYAFEEADPQTLAELGIEDGEVTGSAAEADDAALRDDVAGRMLDQLIVSARNKGCSRVDITDPLASAEPALLERAGFERRGALMSRAIGLLG